MEEYLSILRSAQLFSGVTEAELLSMLTCLDAKTESYPKGSFLLRAGDRTESVGLILSGTVLIIQEDIWGNRNIQSKAGPGQTFAAAFACAQGAVLNVSVVAEAPVKVMFLNVKRILDRLLLSLCPPQSGHPKPSGRIGGQQPAYQRKTHPHVPAHHPRQAHVLSVRHVPARRQLRIRHPLFPSAAGRLSGGGAKRPVVGAGENAG